MELTKVQIRLLRGMYLILMLGQVLTIWPGILFPTNRSADSHTVVSAFLGAFSLLALMGLRYPIKMLPLLLFELAWKIIWALAFALPVWMAGDLDDYSRSVLPGVVLGLIITPIAIPWKYVMKHYFLSPGDFSGTASSAFLSKAVDSRQANEQ